ncbi:hypothetical protein CBR_g3728 [Chara braunii]|uniref:Reverse transcriptase domain-containing protein n=1 Tax=Chara braunii TaxID=69332 RepID=A0A388KG34_CHABU|nr:hypothetical protein CBR_g3728 [Chara braunii]|eukprot:GBG69030.1 hypothetical protein CBR_g3728 [Chara braunii]
MPMTSTVLRKFDIRHGFHHILVKEEDRPKTAFVLFEGTWQWVWCPMRICNAPATFQRAMNVTFQNFVNKTRLTQGMINFCVIVYVDDILVYSDTFHGHAQHIEWTLGALRDAGFKIALEKSKFFLPEISFLGYVVTRGGLQPDSRKVAAVKEAPVLTSLTQVRAFLGLASYYRRFIKGFAAVARPLTNLLRKEQPLHWDDECDQAFGALKDALVTALILIRPDPSRQFILITDWQPEAISAILAQKGNDGKEHVIEYASRTVPYERRNNSAPQGECYAVVWGIQHFHPYLYGQKFLLVTDHEPLLALKKLTNYTGMIRRWAVQLQEYDFDIVHRKMERHGNANGLTRLHRPDPRDIVDPVFYRPPYEDELEEIIREELAEETSEEEEENLNEDEGEPAQQQEGGEDELQQAESEEEAEEESEQGSGDDNDEEQANEGPLLEIAPVADLPISNDPTLDPEPPQPDDGHVAQIKTEVAAEVARMRDGIGKVPGLAVVLVGTRKDSETYVRSKKKACAEVGIKSYGKHLPEDASEDEIVKVVEAFNADPEVHGVLVQLPLPQHVNEERVLASVSEHKDVDGFNPLNLGRLAMQRREPMFVPCTPLGCVEILQRSGVQIAGKRAVVLGRSNIVGMPAALLLQRFNATVTIVHSQTPNPEEITRTADIVISAVGIPELVRGHWLKPGAVVIDVGINPVDDPTQKRGYRLVGDVCFEEAKKVASAVTPVPGGVGPMTIAILLQNTLCSAKRAFGLPER